MCRQTSFQWVTQLCKATFGRVTGPKNKRTSPLTFEMKVL